MRFKGILYRKSRGARKRVWKAHLGETRDCGAPRTLPSGAGPVGLGTGRPQKGPGREGCGALGSPGNAGGSCPSVSDSVKAPGEFGVLPAWPWGPFP